ncbi:hypothetical protein D3C72_2296390 [compost metagenome]
MPQAPMILTGSRAASASRTRQRTGMVWNSEVKAIRPVRTISPLWNFRLPAWPSRKSRYSFSAAAISSRVALVRTDM